MKLLIQPGDGPEALLSGIRNARKSIEIAIFRFDRAEIEAALKAAVGRGVTVHALIAYTNRGGAINLRKLEMRLIAVGVAVSRTADDLARYHDKVMIIDRRLLYVLSFNFTHLDIDHSRGFGIITRNTRFIQEAVKLFEADTTRNRYTSALNTFIVSPANARKVLGAFIHKAKKQLLIYDPKITDVEMLRALGERAKVGVEIKIIGQVGKQNPGLEVRNLAKLRLHTRTIIRDRREASVGSQSLRTLNLIRAVKSPSWRMAVGQVGPYVTPKVERSRSTPSCFALRTHFPVGGGGVYLFNPPQPAPIQEFPARQMVEAIGRVYRRLSHRKKIKV